MNHQGEAVQRGPSDSEHDGGGALRAGFPAHAGHLAEPVVTGLGAGALGTRVSGHAYRGGRSPSRCVSVADDEISGDTFATVGTLCAFVADKLGG